MKSILLAAPGNFILKAVPFPRLLSDDEALVKVHQIGVCGTDLHAYAGKQPFFTYPRILGHELAVEVVEIGRNVANVRQGDRCCVEPYFNPVLGQAARRGKTNCGEHLQVLGVHVDGGMQEYFVCPAAQLHSFNRLTLDQLVLIEPLAIGKHAVDRAAIASDDILLIIGAGPIGLCVAEFAKLTDAKVLVMDIDIKRLDFCREKSGIKDVLLAGEDPLSKLQEYLSGYLPTVVIDATGNKESMQDAFHYVSAGGTLVFVGLFTGDVTFSDPLFHKKELTLKGSRAALSKDFSEIGQLMEEGTIKAEWMITHRLGFEEVITQFKHLSDPGNQVIKAIIELKKM